MLSYKSVQQWHLCKQFVAAYSSHLKMMYNPQPPQDSAFNYPLQCVWLKLNGSWPVEGSKQDANSKLLRKLYTAWSWYVICSVGITIYFQTAFLINTFGDIIMTTENCCTTFMGALNFVRLLHMRLHQEDFKLVIEQFVSDIWIRRNSYPRIEAECARKMRTFRIMTILLACLILMYCVLPLVELFAITDFDNAEKPFPYKMLFPYNANHGARYVFTYLFTSYAGICVVTTLFAEDSIFGFFVTYTCGQFQILHDTIDQLIPSAHQAVLQAYGDVDMDNVQHEYIRRLKCIAYRHNTLIQFANRLEKFFSPILLVNFVISSILICMVGFQLVTGKDMFIGDYIKFIVYISSSLSQLYVLCWNGNSLILYSTETASHLYDCNWEGNNHTTNSINSKLIGRQKQINSIQKWQQTIEIIGNIQHNTEYGINYYPANKEFRKNLEFMIMCSQRPVKITAFKFSTLSLQSFTAILSTSMSYFTLLQTLYYDQDKA